jgi:beta-mannanase
MISWEPWQGLERIASGELDGYIRTYALAAAAIERPLLLRFAHEMNLPGIPWYGAPDLYISAWKHVRGLFREAGAANAQFVWSPYVVDRNAAPLAPYFPGSDEVDWLALDGYNWGRRRWWNRWPSFDAIFGASYAALTRLAAGKPVMLAEIGCSERGGDKAAWMEDALLHAIPDRFPSISAVVWFNQHRLDHADWRIDSAPQTLEVWRRAAADARYSLSGVELLEAVRRSAAR